MMAPQPIGGGGLWQPGQPLMPLGKAPQAPQMPPQVAPLGNAPQAMPLAMPQPVAMPMQQN